MTVSPSVSERSGMQNSADSHEAQVAGHRPLEQTRSGQVTPAGVRVVARQRNPRFIENGET